MYWDQYERKLVREDGGDSDSCNWTCCGEVGDMYDTPAEGCTVGRHKEAGRDFRRKAGLLYIPEIRQQEVIDLEDDSESVTTTPEP